MTLRHSDIQAILQTIDDPEMPISIVDLGMVQAVELGSGPESGSVTVTLLPTFVGCPALPVLEETVQRRLKELPEITNVIVKFVFNPPWSVDRISHAGRESLKQFGVTVPQAGEATLPADFLHAATPQIVQLAVPCPFCNARTTRMASPFGPTRCRMIYYCEACKNSFEHMKRV